MELADCWRHMETRPKVASLCTDLSAQTFRFRFVNRLTKGRSVAYMLGQAQGDLPERPTHIHHSCMYYPQLY